MKLAFRIAFAILAAAIALGGLSACSTMKVQSGHDPSFDFAGLKTWGWAPQSGATKTDAAAMTSERIRLDSLVREHVRNGLNRKGYVQQVGGADVLVDWSFGEWQLERRSQPGGGYGAIGLMHPGAHAEAIPKSKDGRALPPSADPYSSSYEQAKLELLIIDSKTRRIVWNASVTDGSDFGYFTSAQRGRIGDAVDALLEGFPPVP